MNSANNFVLENKTIELKKYLIEAYRLLINAYNFLISKIKDFSEYDENKLRDKLVKKAKKIKNSLYFFWNTEHPNLEKDNRIDIALVHPYSFWPENRNKIIEIECKIISSSKKSHSTAKYIDTKKSFDWWKWTNWIMSFITWKYSEKMYFWGMIWFLKEWQIEEKIKKVKNRLIKSTDIKTIQNLEYFEVEKDFKYSYLSKHKRVKWLGNIDIYHLFFDFTK